MSSFVIEIQELSHTYMNNTPLAKKSLAGVTLTVRESEVVALVGPTGSGKSTLLQHINGLYTPQSGTVRVLGHELADNKTDLTLLRRDVGLVLQNPEHQIFERYVGDDVSFGPRMAGLSGVDLTRRVRWAMELVGLDFETFKDRPTFALSGGERRKVGLAGVVALKPQILLLDEPTAGLDPEAHEELLERLATLHEQGMTLVMATHSMEDVARLADRVIVMDRGAVVAHGAVREVFGRAAELTAIGLGVPVATAIVQALAKRGWDIRQDAITLQEAEDAIRAAMLVTS